jgi:hypothetical protein
MGWRTKKLKEKRMPLKDPVTDPGDERLVPGAENLAQFLAGRPSRFTVKFPYHEVRPILRLLIEWRWLRNGTTWKEPGSGCATIEYPLRGGWRINLKFPWVGHRHRGAEKVTMEFLPPGQLSPPGTIRADHFHSGFAPVNLYCSWDRLKGAERDLPAEWS